MAAIGFSTSFPGQTKSGYTSPSRRIAVSRTMARSWGVRRRRRGRTVGKLVAVVGTSAGAGG